MTSIVFKKKSCKVPITYALVLYLYHKKNRKKFKVLLQLKYMRYMTISNSKIFLTCQSNVYQKINSLFYFFPTHGLICVFLSFGHIFLLNEFFKKLTPDSFISSKIGLFILYKLLSHIIFSKKSSF